MSEANSKIEIAAPVALPYAAPKSTTGAAEHKRAAAVQRNAAFCSFAVLSPFASRRLESPPAETVSTAVKSGKKFA